MRSNPAARLFDAGDQVILPGAVDIHAHINEPGRSDWEGFESATQAAAAGGITTLVDMPLNSIPPTINADALARKIAVHRRQALDRRRLSWRYCARQRDDLPQLMRDGVVGLKCFLCDSGVDEFPPVTLGQLAAAIEQLKGFEPWILVHAESPEVLKDSASRPIEPRQRRRLELRGVFALTTRRSRVPLDPASEWASRKRFRARIHIVHLSSASALPLIAQAKAKHLAITAETCPHYLTFDAESIPRALPS